MAYDTDRLFEFETGDPAAVPAIDPTFAVTWIDVSGLGDIEVLRADAERNGFHPLALVDVVHIDDRAKIYSYPPFAFVVARAALPGDGVGTEQISLFVREGLVISFQERAEDTLGPVRDRIRGGRPRLRNGGADYLAYAILDFAVDSYFPVMERIGDRLEHLEDAILAGPDVETMQAVQEARRELLALRRAAWPHREMLAQVLRHGAPFRDDVLVFVRDVYDHAVQIVDLVENFREIGSDLMGLYLSQISNRMNEVMKVLTMIATVFIPLGFIAGLYGMNFDRQVSPWNMPELGWAFGYPAALGLMGLIAAALLVYFARKGWFR